MKLIELEVPAATVPLAYKLLRSLSVSDLEHAGFSEADIQAFADFYTEIEYQALNNELCTKIEAPQ